MATDIARLRAVLEQYRETLSEQQRRVRDAHGQLTERFGALSTVYDGTGAREFKSGWQQVTATFDAYVDGVPAVLSLLDEKLDQLTRLDEGF